MADVQFAPPLPQLTSPPQLASAPPPPPPPTTPALAIPAIHAPTPPPPATPPPSLRLSAPVPQVPKAASPAPSLQDILQPSKSEQRPSLQPKKKKKKRSKKLLVLVALSCVVGGAGFTFRDSAAMQKLLGDESTVTALPDVPFVRPIMDSVEYSVTLSSVQNGVPNNVTTKVQEDFALGVGQSTIESQTGAVSTMTTEVRTPEFIYRPGQAYGTLWSRQPRVPESPSPYDLPTFIPMIDDIIDQPLRDAMEPTSGETTVVDGIKLMSRTYVIDRAQVPYIAPAIFARVPWLFDVPNASNLTVEVSYDETGLVRHLFIGVDPPQPGTGIDATWVTSYSLDVTTLNAPVVVSVPVEAVDVPAGTP